MRRSKRTTREEIRRAMLRIVHRRPMRIAVDRCRMNISTVAREAGISAASIHNTYADLAEVVRAEARTSARSALDDSRVERKRLLEVLRRTRERLKAAEKNVIRIASENARLVTENAVLKAKLRSRNLVELPAKPTRSLRPERSTT